jgi:hypothetical protein
VSARVKRAARRSAAGAAARRRMPSAAELAAAVLGRAWPEMIGTDPSWRGRAADEAVLLVEVCRWLEGCRRRTGPVREAPLAVVELFADLARSGAALRSVRWFVRIVVVHAHAELTARGCGGDSADVDEEMLVGLLEQCYRERSGARSGPHLTAAERLLCAVPADGDAARPASGSAPAFLVVVLAEPAAQPADLPRGVLAATVQGRLHLLVPIPVPDLRDGAWTEVCRWLAERGSPRAAGAFAGGADEVPLAAESARRLLARPAAGAAGPPAAGSGSPG